MMSLLDLAPNADEPLLPRLPLAYAVALRMHASGATVDDIAAALGIDVPSVGPLLKSAVANCSNSGEIRTETKSSRLPHCVIRRHALRCPGDD